MQGKVKRNYLTYVHVVIMFFIMVGVGMLPTFGQVTPLGMKVLGVFLATLYGWLFLDLLWPSLIGLVALGLTGYTTIGEAFASALSTATGIQVIITCVFASALEKIGRDRSIKQLDFDQRTFAQKSVVIDYYAVFDNHNRNSFWSRNCVSIYDMDINY